MAVALVALHQEGPGLESAVLLVDVWVLYRYSGFPATFKKIMIVRFILGITFFHKLITGKME